ncbi:hypothetical protein Tco_1131791 [Tanacetum coccineum]|uniref:Uncharacterized protein n=1 Tax=Tanacetum coccineum TaxID=301880 RepID=A0ABQ5JBS9_9ASTR
MATRGRKKAIAEPTPSARDPWDEEEEYPFVNKHPSYQEEPIMLGEEESCPVYDTNKKKTKMAMKRKLYIPIMKKKARSLRSISVDLVEEREDDQGSRPCYYNEREFDAGDTNLDATNAIEKVIVERAHPEEELRILERDVKERRDNVKRGKSISLWDDTNAEDGQISKDASEINNAIPKASHDKDNITEVQSSINEMFENVFAHDHAKKHADIESLVRNVQHATERTSTDNKALKEGYALLTKELEQYKERDKYLNDIIHLQAKTKDLENIVCKMGKSSQTLRMLTNEESLYRDNTRKLGLGNKNLCFLKRVVASNPKLHLATSLCDEKVQLHVHDPRESP